MSDQIDGKGWKTILPNLIWKSDKKNAATTSSSSISSAATVKDSGEGSENDPMVANNQPLPHHHQSLANSSIRFKKKGLMTRSISKLSLNSLFHASTPSHHLHHHGTKTSSSSVVDLKQLQALESPSKSRTSFRLRANDLINRTPLRREASGLSYTPTSTLKNSAIIRRHSSKLWSESIDKETLTRLQSRFNNKELRRQEAVFELLQGEKDLIDDFLLVENNYHRPLINLKILSIAEGKRMFEPIRSLLPVHQFLVKKLQDCHDQDGIFSSVGQAILEWVSELTVYRDYCYNQYAVTDSLEELRKTNIRFEDFLERCLQSPFSRRLDLKTLMDNPRLRLMKYPLLFKSIQNYTSDESSDYQILEGAINRITAIIASVDERIGEAHCHSMIAKLDYDKTSEYNQIISQAKCIHCSGFLKNGRGSKLYCVLFDTGFVVARPNHDCSMYLLYRKPIPISNLSYETRETLNLGTSGTGSLPRTMSGSSSSSATNWFRVFSHNSDTSFILLANDEHSRKQWLSVLSKFSCIQQPPPSLQQQQQQQLQRQLLSSQKQSVMLGISPRKRSSVSRPPETYLSPKRNKYTEIIV